MSGLHGRKPNKHLLYLCKKEKNKKVEGNTDEFCQKMDNNKEINDPQILWKFSLGKIISPILFLK